MKARSKITIVVLSSVVLSTLGIFASDQFSGIEANLFGLAGSALGPCDEGSVQFNLKGRALCIDLYEASPGKDCQFSETKSQLDTLSNYENPSCLAVSKAGALPWSFVTHTEARQLCARSGKRLLDNEEWYFVSSGMTNSEACAIDEKSGAPVSTGSKNCKSPVGVYDLVGNVWEWVDAEVINGTYNGRSLPESGYVTLVDTDGLVVETNNVPSREFGNDYAWTGNTGVLGVVRGGYFGSKEDGGIFAVNATVKLDFRSAGIGFRCVSDIPL